MVPVAAAHIPAVQILRRHAIGRVALHIDALDAAAVDEIVDEGAAPGGAQGGVDVGERHAQRVGLGLVDVDMQLRRVVQAVGAHARKQRDRAPPGPAAGCGPAISPAWPRLPRSSISRSKPVALPSSCTAGGTRAKTWASRTAEECHHGAAGDGAARVLRARALAPVASDGRRRCRYSGPTPAKAEAGDGEDEIDIVLFVLQIIFGRPSCATARVRGWVVPAGRVIRLMMKPWSSSGRKPVGRRRNKNDQHRRRCPHRPSCAGRARSETCSSARLIPARGMRRNCG